MKLKTFKLIPAFILLLTYFNGISCKGSVQSGPASLGYTFPILAHGPQSVSTNAGRAFSNPDFVKKGWLKTKGRGIEDTDTKNNSEETKVISEESKTDPPEVKHVTSLSFTNDDDEGYERIIEGSKAEVMDQRESENQDSDLAAADEISNDDGASEHGSKFRSGLTKLYEVHPKDAPLVDPIEYLKQLKKDYARKNQKEIERYRKRRKLMALMERQVIY